MNSKAEDAPNDGKNVCGKPAIAVLVWPSMQIIPVCEECSMKAQAIASAMGFRLGVLPVEEDQTCTQEKRPEDFSRELP